MTRSSRTRPEYLEIDDSDPHRRGVIRGELANDGIHRTIELYDRLFHSFGLDDTTIQGDASAALRSTDRWSPALAAEIEGTASGAGLRSWEIAALNARTEILSQVLGARPGECSVITSVSASTIGAQTWDWHEELSQCWHLQRIRGTPVGSVGLTEFGILGKIGINDHGIAVMLNILGHADDRPGGVPVHLACARVLAECSTIDEASWLLRHAPVTTSSAITVLSADAAVTVELSPHGASVVKPSKGVLAHTNHFLTEQLALGEKPGLYEPDSQERLALLTKRSTTRPPATPADLVSSLSAHAPDGAEICCHPEAGAVFGHRWMTLATITLEPSLRQMRVCTGGPLESNSNEWMRFDASTSPGSSVSNRLSSLSHD